MRIANDHKGDPAQLVVLLSHDIFVCGDHDVEAFRFSRIQQLPVYKQIPTKLTSEDDAT